MTYMTEKRVQDFVAALVTEGSFKHLDLLADLLQDSPAILAYLQDRFGTHSEQLDPAVTEPLETLRAAQGGSDAP